MLEECSYVLGRGNSCWGLGRDAVGDSSFPHRGWRRRRRYLEIRDQVHQLTVRSILILTRELMDKIEPLSTLAWLRMDTSIRYF